MKYLKKFATEADMNMSVTPNVVLVGDTGKVIYNVLNGVYIQHIDGSLYTTDEWTAGGFANDQANGVAVGNGVVKFVIAKEDLSESMIWSSSSAIIGIDDNSENSYDGMKHTALIIEKDPLAVAAPECAKYTFPNGKKGYLPAIGELGIAHDNKASINAALSIVGGVSFVNNSYYWSSNESIYMSGSAITIKWDNVGNSYTTVKESGRSVRPFTTL